MSYVDNFKKALEKEEQKKKRNYTTEYEHLVEYERKKAEAEANPMGGNKDSWVKSGGFSDGVDSVGDFFGDLGETILGTVGDLGLGVLKGAGRLVEGVVDLGTYGVAGVSSLLGADEFAKDAKDFAKTSYVDEWTKEATDIVDKYSVLGNKGDMVSEGLGQVGAIILTGGVAGAAGLGTAGTTALTMGTIGASGVGSGMSEAYSMGASDEEAVTYGLISGASEVITEMLFGGLGKASKAIGIGKGLSSADDILAKKVSSRFTSQIAKNFTEFGIKAGAEGTEEVLSGIMQAVGKKMTYMSEEELSDILADENLLEQFVVATITSGISQSGYVPGMQNGSLRESNKTGRDFITGLTQNEQSVVDKVVEDTISKMEAEGKTLSKKEKGDIYDSVLEQMEHGQLNIDDIESVLGGDAYKAYKDNIESEEALKKELAELRGMKSGEMTDIQTTRMNELKGMNLEDTTKRTELRKQLDDTISPLLQDSKLAETYRERARRGEAFQADLSKYTGKQREAVERAINSGVLNNTYKSHQLVDTLSKIEAEKGIVFNYADNAKLKESGFAIDGKTINGFENNGEVTLNIQSAKAWQSVVGHEITHILQDNTKAYEELQKALFAYAESRGELDSRRTDLTKVYNGINANIDAELTADLVGDYLFTDSGFIKTLTSNRNLFQKIYDEIKYLYKKATGKQLTEIEKVKREFDKAWKELSLENSNEATDAEVDDVNFSVSVTDEETLNSLNEQLAKGEYNAETNPDGGYYVTYKSMSFWGYDEDGNAILRSPMAEYVDGELSNAYLIPKDKSKLNWYQATETIDEKTGLPSGLMVKVKKEGNKSFSYLPASENQHLIADDWSNLYFNLQKKVLKNGKWTNSDVPARYNPYEHSSNSMLNDQFSAAYLRDNLVTVKMYVPISEDNGAYRAQWSKDATGWSDWKTGTVAGKIGKQKDLQRKVYLSRYAAPVEIVPDSEVAQAYKEYLEGTDVTIPDNVVSPNLLNELKKAGVPITESGKVKYSVSEDSKGNELSLAVQKRFANSKAVDENGNLKVLYHGTASGEFYTFDKSKGSVEGDFGSGFYFTDNEYDVSDNYEGGGADFENKVARRAEQIEAEEDIDYSEAEKRAREELYVGSNLFEVYLNIENPAIVGETNLLDPDKYFEEYDRDDYDSEEDYESDVEQLIADDIDQILWDIANNVDVYSTEGLSEVLWNAVNEGGIDIEQLKANINNLYLEDSNGNLVGNEVTRQIIESLGYDGIIDSTVSTKFNMNIEEGTTHYIVFKPNQIKSIDNQNPTDNPDIRYSLSNNPLDNGQELVYNGKRGEGYVRTDEFRNLQAECQGMSDEDIQLYHSGSKQIDEQLRTNIAGVLRTQIDTYRNGLRNDDGLLSLTNKGNEFNMCKSVDGSLFHDVFEIAQKYLRNGELVDLHKPETTDEHGIGYNYCNNYLSEDGLSGFSITPDGDLISVFNTSGKAGFLGAIAPVVKENAKTLDCYNSPNQPLRGMYEKFFGFKTASIMDYNMLFDHDNIAKNHNYPKVAFMVNTESDIETRSFTKDEYDEAVAYRNSFVNQAAENKAASFMPEDIAPVKKSLSYIGEKPSSVGTPLNDLYYGKDVALRQDVAPTQETVKGVEDIAPMTETELPFPDEIAPMTEAEANAIQDEKAKSDAKAEGQPKTRKQLHNGIIENIKSVFRGKGFDFDTVLRKAKNLSTFRTVDNTPQRVMEKALGYKEGQALADLTVNKVAQNETEGIKWLNSFTDRKNGLLAQISKQYNIKPGSKESAAAQMYAEGFYVNENNDIVAYGDAELAQDFPNATVRSNIKGLAHDPRIRQIYDETLAAINESRTRNAYPEIQKLDNYFLHFRAMDDTFSKLGVPFNPNDIRAKDLPTDLNGVTADLKPGQPYFASAMHRTGKRTSFDLLGGLERYLTSAKNQIYHIDDIQTLRALRNYIADTYGQANGLEGIDALTEEEAQERIEQVYGSHLSTFAKFLNEEANVLAGKTALIDRGLEGIIGRRGITFLNTVNQQVGSNMVGFNVSSSLTNFIPVAQTFAKSNKADFVKAFAQTVSNKLGSIVGKSDGFAENSPVIIRRKGADRFYRTPFQKVADKGYVLMSAVDNISTELIARTKFNELTRKGMSEQQAHFETDKWVSRLMGDRSLGQMPQLYNSKMLGLVTKFQLEVRNQLDSQFYDTIQEAKASSEDIKNGLSKNAKTAAKVASTFVQLAVVQHLFGKAFESVAGYNPAFDIIEVLSKAFGFDDEEDSEDTALDNLEQGFLALLEDLPYTSTFTGGRIPISSALPISELIQGKDEYGNEKSRLETLGEVAPYYVLPGGYGQIKKTTQGLNMFSDEHPVAGSYTDSGNLRFPVEDTLKNRIQAGIFGQYASENAREYFDNDYAPLKEKQIQEYIDVDMPIKDYWKYRKGLAKQETLEDKFDYIAGLDLTVEQKNILINNVVDRKEEVDLENYDDFSSLEEFDYATKNPDKYAVAKSVGGYSSYKTYSEALYDIKADKDENGKSINGSRKEKVIAWLNELDADYETKIILFKSEYPSDDTYNQEIIEYINNRNDLTYEERIAIYTELGFTVKDGYVYWN